MILTLFLVFVVISLIMIIIGLTRGTESAQAIIGFFFLFLLSIVVISGNLEYETGAVINSTLIYNGSSVVGTTQQVAYSYNSFDDTTSHRIGYFLAVASAVGMAGVFYSLKRTNWREE